MLGKAVRMTVVAGLGVGLTACAGGPGDVRSGFLTSYEGLVEREDTVRASVLERRDEALAAAIDRLWIAPAEVFGVADPVVSDADRRAVLAEVDRQICYELSERFDVVEAPDPAVASVRVGVTRIHPTHQAGSAAAAVANFFIPGPINVRAPGGTGGLGAEVELLTADGRQAAAIVWRRDAMVVGTDKPSLSRIGDAHQPAEPLGDMVGDAFAPADRKVRPIPSPDPCQRFGPRNRPEGFVAGLATGLYVPELSGARSREQPADTPQ